MTDSPERRFVCTILRSMNIVVSPICTTTNTCLKQSKCSYPFNFYTISLSDFLLSSIKKVHVIFWTFVFSFQWDSFYILHHIAHKHIRFAPTQRSSCIFRLKSQMQKPQNRINYTYVLTSQMWLTDSRLSSCWCCWLFFIFRNILCCDGYGYLMWVSTKC